MATEKDGVPLPNEAKRLEGKAPQASTASQPADSFWARIKRHKVVEWTLAYVAFGYTLLHGVQMLRETFEWPLLVPRLTVVGLALGAPIAVTLAWYHGHRARHRISGVELSILIALLVVAGSVLWRVSRNHHEHAVAAATTTVTPAPPVTPFKPPPHSVAVLPFVNMSGDKEQEYFSQGLTEELLNALSRINELQVAARTSSFSFQGEHPDIATVAHKLNVGAVLEGSVRRSAHTIRITAQLVDGITGFHLWSQTYDRDLGDVLALQTEIATAVAGALKVQLLGGEAAKIEVGGTRNATAFDAYLRASSAYWSAQNGNDYQAAIAGYTEAIRWDPNYALAYADRAFALADFAQAWLRGPTARDSLDKAQTDARKAIALAPDLADGHLALGSVFEATVDYTRASQEYGRALALAPGNAKILATYGMFAVRVGKTDAGLAAARRSVVLDPLNAWYRSWLGVSLWGARRYAESIVVLRDAKALAPNDVAVNSQSNAWLGYAYYTSGDFQSARAACAGADEDEQPFCFALTSNKLGERAAAETMLSKLQASAFGAAHPLLATVIYAQWGDTARALDWLETAMRVRDPFLVNLKVAEWFDPLRNEPRFKAVETALKFPE
jgi:serine/threonine-protein kinase